MENSFNLQEKKIKSGEILMNKDLQLAMDFIQEDFKFTKENIIKLTHHLDKLENTYNLLHKEHSERNKLNG
jgi:hypothetical protein